MYVYIYTYMYLSGGYRSSKQKLNHESLDLKTKLKHGKNKSSIVQGGTIIFYKPGGPKYKEIMTNLELYIYL